MPHDASPKPQPSVPVSDESLAALRAAIRRRLTGEPADSGVRRALRRLSEEAHEKGLRAEQLVILLKHVWTEVAGVPRPLDQHEQRHMLGHLVTLCIDEYYAE